MTQELLTKIFKSKKELEGVPVIGNVDFGRTIPSVSVPNGGSIWIGGKSDEDVHIEIIEH